VANHDWSITTRVNHGAGNYTERNKMSKYDQTFRELNRAQTPSALALIASALAGLAGLYIFATLVLSL